MWKAISRVRLTPWLLTDQVLDVLVVLVTDELLDFLIRGEVGASLDGIGLHHDSWVFDRRCDLQVAQIRTTVAIDNMELIGMRMQILVQPNLIVEAYEIGRESCRER